MLRACYFTLFFGALLPQAVLALRTLWLPTDTYFYAFATTCLTAVLLLPVGVLMLKGVQGRALRFLSYFCVGVNALFATIPVVFLVVANLPGRPH